MVADMCFLYKGILIIKPPKRSPMLLRTAVFTFSMVCVIIIFSVCLKQISTQARTKFMDLEVIDNLTRRSVKKTDIPYMLHYPKPISFNRNECAQNPVRFFAILSNQRSGSGWFETLLNSHINASSNGEVFSVRERRKNASSILQTLDRVYNLDRFSSASKNECFAAIGLKWMLNQMEGKLAEELYAESLQLSKLELAPPRGDDQEDKLKDRDGDNLSLDDSLWDDASDDKLDSSSDLDREWQRRHDQFHTMGYRDGLIAAKEAAAQEGFNIGFKQSVFAGYSWGTVRGVTSAFAYLPDLLKEKLVEKLEKRNEFQGLYESVQSLSTTDALRLFHEDIKAQEALEQSEHEKDSSHTTGLQEQTSYSSRLTYYHGQLQSLINDCPVIGSNLPEPK